MFKPSILLAKCAMTAIQKLLTAMLPRSQVIDAMLAMLAMLACTIKCDAPVRGCPFKPESEAIHLSLRETTDDAFLCEGLSQCNTLLPVTSWTGGQRTDESSKEVCQSHEGLHGYNDC